MNLFKKLVFKSTKMLVAFGFALSTMSMPYIQANAAVVPPGTVTVSKVAADIGGGLYEITLTVTGVPDVKPSDIVLVMDTSTSMRGEKFAAMKDAAVKFVNSVIDAGKGHRIAIVAFANDPYPVQDFTLVKSDLIDKIEGLQLGTYTHLEGGIYLARQLLASNTAVLTHSKNIVVLGDGMPNRGYDFNPVYKGDFTTSSHIPHSGDTATCQINNIDGTILNNSNNYNNRYLFTYGVSIPKDNVNANSPTFSKNVTVSTPCPNNGGTATKTFSATFSFADSVLWQAKEAWASGYQVFSIGLGLSAGDIGATILNSIDNAGYFNGNTDTLSGIYDEIASKIINAGTDAVLEDKMGDKFTFVDFSTGFTSPEYSINRTTEILTWNIGIITLAPQILKYIVRIDPNLPSNTYPTNAYAKLTYKNISGIDDIEETISPEVVVENANVAPTAKDDNATVYENSIDNIINVLANDSFAPDLGETLVVTAVTAASHGTAKATAGVVTYTPSASYFGDDSFTYTISDGNGGTDSATVYITVTNVNDNPTANPDSATVAEDSINNPINVLANDTIVPDVGETLTVTGVTQPANGTAAFTALGVTYTPNANYYGSDSFTYTISDGNTGTATATVTMTVTSVNDKPTAVDDNATVIENSLDNIINVLANDSFAPDLGETLVVTAVGAASHGTAKLTAGVVTYTPNASYIGSDSFTYDISDGNEGTASATVYITVTNVNDNPTAYPDSKTVLEDSGSTFIDVLANDTIVPDVGETLSVTGVTQPVNGTVTFTAAGVNYTPKANFFGTDTFTYTISDGNEGTATATVTMTVEPVNDNPTANPDSATVLEDSGSTFVDVLTNDSFAPDFEETLTVIGVTQPANGLVTFTAAGVNYTPNANFFGTDTFTYTISDGNEGTATATVTMTVEAVNDAPVAHSDEYVVNEDTTLDVPQPGVLANDTDADGDSLIAILVQEPEHGTLIFNEDGSFSYEPEANYSGSDSFTYYAFDGELSSETVTVYLTVKAVNDAPVAEDDNYTTAEDTALVVAAPGVLVNDTDVDSPSLTAVLVSSPANGTLVLNADGSFTYTPNANFNGTDSFDYRAFDGEAESYVATVTLSVTAVNDAPTAANATYTILRGAAISRLLARGDVDGDPLTFEIVSGPAHGSLVVNAAGRFTYVHDGIALTSDTFTYRVSDGALVSPTRTIRINFSDLPIPNVAPVVTDSSFNTPFNTALNNDVAPNGSDADGDQMAFILVGQPAHGTVTLSPSGSFHYVPTTGYNGPDSFTYKVNDGKDDSNVATANITVAKEIIITPEPTPTATMPWWWLLGLLPFLLFLIRRPRPEVQEVVLNPDGTITTTWGYLGPRLMHKDYDRDESVLEVVSGDVKVVPPLEKIPYEFDKGRHENIFKTVSDKNAVIRWTIKKKAEELDQELIAKMLEKNKK